VGLSVLSMLLGFHPEGLAEEPYTVKPGDSLYRISKSCGVSVEVLKKANGLEGDGIKPEQVLLIPGQGQKRTVATVERYSVETESYVVRKGDSLFTISKRVGLSVEEIKRMNRLRLAVLKVGQILILPRTRLREETKELDSSEESTVERQAEEEGGKQEVAEPLGKWSNQEERNLFVRVVKTFLGAPYRLGGSTLKGIDCSAFVKKIYEVFNVHLPRTVREQVHIGKKVEKYELEEGDLVFFKTRRSNNGHVGIYIGNNEFVHASRFNKEVKVDNLNTPYFNRCFLKGVRVKELEQES
jgi:peptidoglycan endopeptidase LytE